MLINRRVRAATELRELYRLSVLKAYIKLATHIVVTHK